jgi:DnaJ-class molecular chaperone
MTRHSLYDTLGLGPGASDNDIKRAYKQRAMRCHPDKGGDAEEFKRLNNAHETLAGMSPQDREAYDRLGDEVFAGPGGPGGPGGFPGGFPFGAGDPFGAGGPFGAFFGFGPDGFGAPQRPRKRQDGFHVVEISLREAYHGTHRKLCIGLQSPCAACKKTCATCDGKGETVVTRALGILQHVSRQPCQACGGDGAVSAGCAACAGGRVKSERIEELRLPPGVEDGYYVRFEGAGEQPARDDDEAGDLVVVVKVRNDPDFERRGDDLHRTERLPLRAAFAGGRVRVPHPAGDFDLDLRPLGIVRPGAPHRLPGKGMPRAGKRRRAHGDLVLTFEFDYPDVSRLDDDAVRAFEAAFDLIEPPAEPHSEVDSRE